MYRSTTPKFLNAEQQAWLKDLNLGTGVRLDDSEIYMPQGFCQLNVAIHCMENPNDEIVAGWMMWTSPIITELEFHRSFPKSA